MVRALISILFDGMENLRVQRTRRHELADVLFVALIGGLVGERGWDGVADDAEAHEDELLKLLDARKAVVTMDATGCPKDIAKTIVEKGADDVFGLKRNPPTLHDEVLRAFDEDALVRARACPDSYDESEDKGHGRLEN